MKTEITWFLVADGARARLFEREGGKGELGALWEDEIVGPHLATRDIQADRPGRTFDSAGEARHAKEPPTDPHRHQKREFMRMLAGRLEKALEHRRYDRLVLVAPPQALGDLRDVIPDKVKARVIHEVAKDLTNVSLHDLPRHLEEVLRS